MSSSFQAAFDQHVGTAFTKQLAFADYIGEYNWQANTITGQIDFGQQRVFPMQILGTESELSGTWLWAWANEDLVSSAQPRVLQAAQQMRAYGKQHAIPELTKQQLNLDGSIDGHRLALLASGVCGADCYFRGPYEGGAVFVMLYQTPLRMAPPPDLQRIISVLTQTIQIFPMDHRLMVKAYLTQQGFSAQAEKWRAADGRSIAIQYDDLGRISKIDATMQD